MNKIENWLREPPEWFLNLAMGVSVLFMVVGAALVVYGLVGLMSL